MSERKRPHGLLDYDDLVPKALDLLRRPGGGALGAVQARWRARPHPDRRGAGHQPRAMGDRRRAGRGILRRRGRAASAPARCSRSATRSSRSTASSAPTRAPFCECGSISRARVTAASQEWRGGAARHLVPLHRSRCCRRSTRCFGHDGAADGVALDGGAIRHVAARAGQAGLVELWPPVLPRARRSRPIRAALPIAHRRVAEPHTRLAARDRRDDRAAGSTSGERLEARGRPVRGRAT